MKRTMPCILCAVLALMLALLPALALANYGYYYVKTGNGKTLNVRTEPRADAKVVSKIPYRSIVLVYEYTENGTWAYIETDNPKSSGTVKGWVNTSYLVSYDPGPYKGSGGGTTEEPTFSDINGAAKALKILAEPMNTVIKTKKAANLVHLRWFPSTSACYSGAYLANTEIKVLAMSKSWAQVEVLEDGHVGFILRSCVME